MLSMRAVVISAGLALSSSVALAQDFTSGSGLPLLAFARTNGVNWTGYYIGLQSGAMDGQAKLKGVNGDENLNSIGYVGGLYAGYNYQIGPFVPGVEGEFGYSGASASKTEAGSLDGYAINTVNSERQDYEGRIRAKLGYANGNLMIFGAGGWTFGNSHQSVDYGFAPVQTGVTIPASVTSALPVGGSTGRALSGWNVGGGVEYALLKNWTVRVEYIRDNFSNVSYKSALLGNTKGSITDNTVRIGIGFKF